MLIALGKVAIELSSSQLGRIMALVTSLGRGDDRKSLTKGVIALETAVKFYADHSQGNPDEKPATVSMAVDKLITQWKADGMNPKYVSNAGGILRRFAATYPDRLVSTMTAGQIQAWILTLSEGMRVGAKARVSALYSFCILQGWVNNNPCVAFKLHRRAAKAVIVPTPQEVNQFLKTASQAEWKPLLAYFAVRFFSGLRRDEASQIQWKHIDLSAKKLRVPQWIAAKRGPAREVPIADNFAKWLEYCRGNDNDKVAPPGIERLEHAYRKQFNFTGSKWQNALRHCFGSYRYPQLQNLDVLAGEMGNSRRVLCTHYVGAVSAKDVADYWAIVPTQS